MLPLTVPLTPAYPYPFPPPPTAKRANTLLLKHKLVELLPPEQGKIYWSLLCDLVTGKITREEFELGWRDHLDSLSHGLIDTHTGHNRVVDHDQLAYLHNALLLSILYNTTKPTLPPASVAHTGWTSKRKRGGIDAQGEGPGADPLGEYARKRRRLKRLVAGMTKGEKKRLRLLLNNRDKKGHDPMHLPPVMESIAEKTRLGLMPASAGLKTPNSAALQQEIQRAQATPTCLESGELPDLQSMADRMAGVAYPMALTGGVNSEAAALASVALDVYLKDVLSALLAVAQPEVPKQASVNKPKGSKKGKGREQAGETKTPTVVSRNHVLSLFELSPSILHSRNVPCVERFIAHQHLYELPPREERVQMLEARMEQQENAVASTSKTPITAELPLSAVSVPNAADSLSSATNAAATASGSGSTVKISDSTNSMIPTKSDLTASPAGKTKDLAFELFPELPSSAKPNVLANGASSPLKKQFMPNGEERNGNAATVPEGLQASKPNTPVVNTGNTGPAKDTSTKESSASKARKELQRGRFGIWKLLTGILEGSAGNQNMQGNLRFQHSSVL